MKKEQIIIKIKESGLVAVVRADCSERVIEITEACICGGIAAIELTFTTPFAHHMIEQLAKRYTNDEIIIGAGTVLDSETARIAILSGAEYVVSPYFNPDIITLCNRYRVLSMPGIMTITEAVSALECGADILKLFPGDYFGCGFIKTIKGPLPQVEIMPTGGVDADNVGEWIRAGAVAVGAGSSLTHGSYDEIVQTARKFIKNIKMSTQNENVPKK
ncbi:MAG: bifunctional 2-keto-4-hydroxyglutarate aldolase/2-keto-3-deoxy-6-phosphogluconate aldolase [Saccharofermentanales bacterium]